MSSIQLNALVLRVQSNEFWRSLQHRSYHLKQDVKESRRSRTPVSSSGVQPVRLRQPDLWFLQLGISPADWTAPRKRNQNASSLCHAGHRFGIQPYRAPRVSTVTALCWVIFLCACSVTYQFMFHLFMGIYTPSRLRKEAVVNVRTLFFAWTNFPFSWVSIRSGEAVVRSCHIGQKVAVLFHFTPSPQCESIPVAPHLWCVVLSISHFYFSHSKGSLPHCGLTYCPMKTSDVECLFYILNWPFIYFLLEESTQLLFS